MSNSSFTWKICSDLTSGHQLFLDTCRDEAITAFQGSLLSTGTQLSMQGDARRAELTQLWTWAPLLTLLPVSWDLRRVSLSVWVSVSSGCKLEGEELCFRWCSEQLGVSGRFFRGCKEGWNGGKSVGGDTVMLKESCYDFAFCVFGFE